MSVSSHGAASSNTADLFQDIWHIAAMAPKGGRENRPPGGPNAKRPAGKGAWQPLAKKSQPSEHSSQQASQQAAADEDGPVMDVETQLELLADEDIDQVHA